MDYSEVKKTKKFCSHRREDGIVCPNYPSWRICNSENKVKLKVCDEHLAWAIRTAGYPAIVDAEKVEKID